MQAPAPGWCSTSTLALPTPARIQLPPGHATRALGPLRRSRTRAAPPSAVEHACFQANPCRDGREKHERVIGEGSERTDTSGALRGGNFDRRSRIQRQNHDPSTSCWRTSDSHVMVARLALGVHSTIRPTNSTEPALASRHSTMHQRHQRGHRTHRHSSTPLHDHQRMHLLGSSVLLFFFSILLFAFRFVSFPFLSISFSFSLFFILWRVSATEHVWTYEAEQPEHALPRMIMMVLSSAVAGLPRAYRVMI